MVDQYERELQYYVSTDPNITMTVVCPVCQKNLISLNNQMIECKCGVRLKWPQSLASLSQHIQNAVNKHEQTCLKRLIFIIEPNFVGENALSACCAKCEYFASVIE